MPRESNSVELAEVECVECEERVGFVVIGDKLGHVADPARAPMVICLECGYRIEAEVE